MNKHTQSILSGLLGGYDPLDDCVKRPRPCFRVEIDSKLYRKAVDFLVKNCFIVRVHRRSDTLNISCYYRLANPSALSAALGKGEK